MKTNALFTFLMINFCSLAVLASEGISVPLSNDSIKVNIQKINGNVHLLYCTGGFAGGNVAASIGKDGVLLVDNMYASMSGQISKITSQLSKKPIRIVLNTHFHGDHIQGNLNFGSSAVIIGHENLAKRLRLNDKPEASTLEMMPMVTFTDSLYVDFNGEKVTLLHYPNAHTDGDAVIYFGNSKVLHLGDMFFFGMFPAVYANGGGNIKQLIVALDQILKRFPADTHVIPGHGDLATMKDLAAYIEMLKETVAIVEQDIKLGKSLTQLKQEDVLSKYNKLGSGGAQTTEQYLTMLYNLLKAG